MAERVVLVRHGETDWSSTRRHTGRSDIPLNDEGRRLAASLQAVLVGISGIDTALVLTSPLRRGRRTVEIRVEVPGWTVWTHDPVGGETLDDVTARADRVLTRIHDTQGVVLAVAHAHILRVLTARWCGLDPRAGRMFVLD